MKKSAHFSDYISLSAAIFCFVSMYVFPNDIKNAVRQALSICASSVIPSLFPFIVASRWLTSSYLSAKANSKNGKAVFAGISGNGITAYILGTVSGFPAGALSAGLMYQAGCISKTEAEKICAYSSVVSPAFCIVFFGNGIVKSSFCGLVVFLSLIAVNFFLLIADAVLFKSKSESSFSSEFRRKNNASFSEIVADSCSLMLNICAYVTIFLCIGNVITKIIGFAFGGSEEIKAFVCGILEISGGTALLENLPFGRKLMLGAMLMGFGGISAAMQVIGVCRKYLIDIKRFLLAKAISAVLVPPVTFFLFVMLPCNLNKITILKYCLLFGAVFVVAAALLRIILKINFKKHCKSKDNLQNTVAIYKKM